MKTTPLFKMFLALMTVLGFLTLGTPTAKADDHRGGYWDRNHHYMRDNYGYWNSHQSYRHYVYWNNHHGYWDQNNGVRVFINVD